SVWGWCAVGYAFFFFQAEDGIRDWSVTGVQTCALPISPPRDGKGPPTKRRDRRSRARSELSGHRQPPVQSERAAARPGAGRRLRSEERRVGKEWRARGAAEN